MEPGTRGNYVMFGRLYGSLCSVRLLLVRGDQIFSESHFHSGTSELGAGLVVHAARVEHDALRSEEGDRFCERISGEVAF